jgi:hypothetical protein
MLYRATGWLFLSVFFLTLSGTAEIAECQKVKKKSTQSTKKQAKIEGFRSAKFGMKEKDVYRAIAKDFKISKSKIKRKVNSLEKTSTLTITIPELLGVGGAAQIGYIFGYKSKKLVQVNVVWGASVDKKVDSQSVINAANFLRTHLNKKSYKADGLVANARIDDQTTIVFRGKDKKNRMVVLILNSEQAPKDGNAKKTSRQFSLKLSYILDAENPDVLTITIKDDDF